MAPERLISEIMLRRLSLHYGNDGGPGSVDLVRRTLGKAAKAGTLNLAALLASRSEDFEHDLILLGYINLHTGRLPVGKTMRSA